MQEAVPYGEVTYLAQPRQPRADFIETYRAQFLGDAELLLLRFTGREQWLLFCTEQRGQLLCRTFKNCAKFQQEFVPRRQKARLVDRPEPQGAPVVHRELQALIRAGLPTAGGDGAFEDLVALVRGESLPAFGEGRVRLLPKDRENMGRVAADLAQVLAVLLP